MKHAALLTLVSIIVLACSSLPSPRARAASGPDCTWYDYQQDAQYDLDTVLNDYPDIVETYRELDLDRDGVACPELPKRPRSVEDSQRIRGHFEPDLPFVGIRGSGYSAWYDARLAGVTLDPGANEAAKGAPCPELVTNHAIADLFALPEGAARQYYIKSTTGDELPPGDIDDEFEVTVVAWTVLEDPAAPVLVNEWLIANGLAFLDPETVRGRTEQKLQNAQDAAQSARAGMWGTCEIPGRLAPEPTVPPGQIVHVDGVGDQVVPFSVSAGGTYVLTLQAKGSGSTFAAADVYGADGTWHPEFSITTAQAGSFSSAASLAPGAYYVQIKAVGGWQVALQLLQ